MKNIRFHIASSLMTLAAVALAAPVTRTLKDGAGEYVFEVRFPAPLITRTAQEAGRSYSSVAMDGLPNEGLPGNPSVPRHLVSVGVPAGDCRIEVTPLEVKEAALSLPLLPSPNVRFRDKVGETYYAANPVVYALETYPADGWWASAFTRVANQRMVQLTLYPVIYKPRTNRLEYASGFRVALYFNKSGSYSYATGYENVLKEVLLNYESAKSFRIRPFLAKISSAASDPLSEGDILKLVITNTRNEYPDGEGLYVVSGASAAAAGLHLSNSDIDEIRLYAVKHGVVRSLSYAADEEEAPVLREVPVLIEDVDGDGIFDPEDRVLFYGYGDAWYRPGSAGLNYEYNPFDGDRPFWLVFNSRATGTAMRMEALAAAPVGTPVRKGFFTDRTRREAQWIINPTDGTSEKEYRIFWAWKLFTPQYPAPYFSEDPLSYLRNPAAAASRIPSRIRFQVDNSSGGVLYKYNLALECNGQAIPAAPDGAFPCTLRTDLANSLRMSSSSGDTAFFDWYEVEYPRLLRTSDGQLLVYAFEGADTAQEYAATGFTGAVRYCVDVSDPFRPRLADARASGDTLFLVRPGSDPAGNPFMDRKYIFSDGRGLKSPRRVERYGRAARTGVVRDLWNTGHRYDEVIVTAEDFYEPVRRLATHRDTFSMDPVSRCAIVYVEDVWDQFGGGRLDPAGLRNFLLFAQKRWGMKYALLFGFGHREYRNTSIRNIIPPYVPFVDAENSVVKAVDWTVTDDYFCGGSAGLRFFIGRIPAKDLVDASAVVSKIIGFETDRSSQLAWRNRALLFADDDHQLTYVDGINNKFYRDTSKHYDSSWYDTNHMFVTDSAASHCPTSMERVRMFIQKYPPSQNGTSREKPLAEYDLLGALNRGNLVWTYVGHGGFDRLTSEKVFTLENTLPRMRNTDKYGFFWAASCNVGEFDNPNQESICSRLLVVDGAGMVATVGASRTSYPDPNANLLYKYFHYQFNRAPDMTLGECLQTAKIAAGLGSPDYQKYNLFGDPALYLYPRKGLVRMDDSAGLDTLRMLQRIHLTGRVVDSTGLAVNGQIMLRLTAPEGAEWVRFQTSDNGDSGSVRLRVPGDALSSDVTAIRNGVFAFDLVLPRNVPFYTTGSAFKFFACYNGRVAERVYSPLFFSGEVPADSLKSDGKGPSIRAYVNNLSGISGGAFETPPVGENLSLNRKSVLTVMLEDSDGVQTLGRYVNEGVRYEFPGLTDIRRVEALNGVDNAPFRKTFNLIMEQELFGVTRELSGRTFDFVILAKDNFDNLSRASYKVRFDGDSGLALSRDEIYNWPNPFRKETRFIWSSTVASDVVIKIFTQSGRLIRVLESRDVRGAYSPGANSLWDGLDETGHAIARGIYWYKIYFKRKAPADINAQPWPEEKPIIGKMMKY